MALHEINFASYNGRDTIKAWMYTPIVKPRAVVQIVHGFGEHSRRYFHMILTLLDAGFVVCADDHVAHGKTAADSGTWGDPGDMGFMTTIEDEHTLRGLVTEKYPDLPFVMFGHSWGSMIARGYTAVYSAEMAGVIYCGTAAADRYEKLNEGLRVAAEAGQGREPATAFIAESFGGMTDRFDNPNGLNDWIARSPEVVADHGADPFNNLGNTPTVQLLYDFDMLYEYISGEAWAKIVREDMPVYLIAGDQDPVGNFGEGVYHVANLLWDTGHKHVTTRLYSGYRHEIHNEPEIRDEVEKGIVCFIEKLLSN